MLYHHLVLNLVDLLHGRDVLLLQRGHLIIIVVVILKDGESELDEPVDAAGGGRRQRG